MRSFARKLGYYFFGLQSAPLLSSSQASNIFVATANLQEKYRILRGYETGSQKCELVGGHRPFMKNEDSTSQPPHEKIRRNK